MVTCRLLLRLQNNTSIKLLYCLYFSPNYSSNALFASLFCTSLQALIDEDRLLSRLEVMGNQLQAYSKVRLLWCKCFSVTSRNSSQHSAVDIFTIPPEPNGGRHPKGACRLNGGQTQLRDYSQRVPEAGTSGENRGGSEAVRSGGKRDRNHRRRTRVRSVFTCLDSRRFTALFQRTLSNTEDECTHLKEMNERTQEELRELANKYNGAVNEIKDLTDKIKARTISVFIQDVEIKSPHFMMPLLSPHPFSFFLSAGWRQARGAHAKRPERKEGAAAANRGDGRERASTSSSDRGTTGRQRLHQWEAHSSSRYNVCVYARARTDPCISFRFKSLVGQAENLMDFPSTSTLPPGSGHIVQYNSFTLKWVYEREKESPWSSNN